MLLLRNLSLRMPPLPFLVGELLPREANDLRERAVVRLDAACHALAFNEGRAEEDEGIGKAGNVVGRFFACRGRRSGGGVKTRSWREV